MNLRQIKLISLSLLTVAISNPAVHADLIWLRGQQLPPMAGQIISQTESQIKFRPFIDGAYQNAQTFTVEEIEQSIVTLDRQRLEKLDPNKPAEYRDYAEELAAHVSDPAAIDLARRLYLLAAYHSSGAIRSGSISGLISLANSDANRRQLKMLQLIDNPQFSNFEAHEWNGLDKQTPTQAEKQLMLKLILALRQERPIEASNILSSAENRDSLNKWNEQCTLGEFDRIATVNRPSKLQLSKLLTIEVMVRQPSSNRVGTRRQGWGDLAMQSTGSFGVLPTFKNVTRFDPDQSVFRNNRWVLPARK